MLPIFYCTLFCSQNKLHKKKSYAPFGYRPVLEISKSRIKKIQCKPVQNWLTVKIYTLENHALQYLQGVTEILGIFIIYATFSLMLYWQLRRLYWTWCIEPWSDDSWYFEVINLDVENGQWMCDNTGKWCGHVELHNQIHQFGIFCPLFVNYALGHKLGCWEWSVNV